MVAFLFSVVYFSKGIILTKKGKRALLGNLVVMGSPCLPPFFRSFPSKVWEESGQLPEGTWIRGCSIRQVRKWLVPWGFAPSNKANPTFTTYKWVIALKNRAILVAAYELGESNTLVGLRGGKNAPKGLNSTLAFKPPSKQRVLAQAFLPKELHHSNWVSRSFDGG